MRFINRENKLEPVFKKYPILFAYLFGSYAKARVRKKSDVDIAVFFDRRIQEKQRDSLRGEIRESVAHILKKYDQIDIVALNDVYPLLEKEIIYNGKLIYSKDDAAQAHYQARAVSRWLDYKWHYDRWTQKILNR